MKKRNQNKPVIMPQLTPAAERQISRLCSLLKVDQEMLKCEIRCAIETAFLEGYNNKIKVI